MNGYVIIAAAAAVAVAVYGGAHLAVWLWLSRAWRAAEGEECYDAANGYRVGRGPKETANDWESLRGIDISLRRIADVLEELNERIDNEDD